MLMQLTFETMLVQDWLVNEKYVLLKIHKPHCSYDTCLYFNVLVNLVDLGSNHYYDMIKSFVVTCGCLC